MWNKLIAIILIVGFFATLYFSVKKSIVLEVEKKKDVQTIGVVKCDVKKLDNFVNNEPVDFIKCDVEGAELLVFKGGLNTIQKFKPIIFTELLRKWSKKFEYNPQDVVLMLRAEGYNCYIIDGENLVEINQIDEKTVQTNFLFLHQQKHEKQINELVL